MNNILIIGASNSATSINRTLASYVGSLMADCKTTVLDLNDYEMPIYSPQREEADGIPNAAPKFIEQIEATDGIIISLAEHNGSYSSAFKNIFDWSTRQKQKLWSGKPMLLLSTSPGGRGGSTVLEAAKQSFPHLGANIVASFSLPSYYDNFSGSDGIKDTDLNSELQAAVKTFSSSL